MLSDDVLFGLDVLRRSRNQPFYKDTAPKFKQMLAAASRYNLSDNVVQAATSLIATKPTNLVSYLDFAKRLHPLMWIEFPVKARTDYLISLGITPIGLQPSRVGVLIDDHPRHPGDLSCGRALVCWRHVNAPMSFGEVAYTELRWEFNNEWVDWRTAKEKHIHFEMVGKSQASVSWLFRDSPQDKLVHAELMARFDIRPSWLHLEWINDYFKDKTLEEQQQYVQKVQGDATSESSTVLAILILFNTRHALNFESVSQDKLNKARAKTNKPPLFEYKNVSFYLSRATKQAYSAKGLTVQQGVVLQKVPGHFRSRYSIRRGTRELFWIAPFKRGDAAYGLGPSITHTRTVKL